MYNHRKATIKTIKHYMCQDCDKYLRDGGSGVEAACCVDCEVTKMIRELQKPQTGEWEWEWEMFGGADAKEFCHCSNCKLGHFYEEYNYCPNCGADMRGEER